MAYTHLQRTWLIKTINQVADYELSTADAVDAILEKVSENYNLKSNE